MADMQTTYIMIKPDGVQRGLVGEIINRFERKGLRMVGLRQLTPSMELAEAHYAVHSERPFYSGLIEFITSGPVVAMAWTGVDAIQLLVTSLGRQMVEKRRLEQSVGTGLWILATTSFTAVMEKILQHSNLDYGSQMDYVTGY